MYFFQFFKKGIKNNLSFLIATALASAAIMIGVSLGLSFWLGMTLWAIVVGYSWGSTDNCSRRERTGCTRV